jgi:hypothetical protein
MCTAEYRRNDIHVRANGLIDHTSGMDIVLLLTFGEKHPGVYTGGFSWALHPGVGWFRQSLESNFHFLFDKENPLMSQNLRARNI